MDFQSFVKKENKPQVEGHTEEKKEDDLEGKSNWLTMRRCPEDSSSDARGPSMSKPPKQTQLKTRLSEDYSPRRKASNSDPASKFTESINSCAF